jgi:UDP-2,3-diacylglucosamine hydrolase
LNIPHAFLMSDLHLDTNHPELTAILLDFLRGGPGRVPALFLLGDIFEAWVGDDDDQPLVTEVADALAALAASGRAIYFMHGNRDFLLREDYAARAGMQLLADPCRLTLGGVPTVLSHGDALCTDDVAYQAFRAQSRHPAWQSAILAMPLAERRLLAARLRQESMQGQARQMADGVPLADVNEAAVASLMREHGVTRLIHGHTHRPAVHAVPLADGITGERVVLSDWRDCGEVLEVRADGSWIRHVLGAG